MTVEVAQDIASLEHHLSAWEDLAIDAVERNVFYEPWMVMPALRAFGFDSNLKFVLIYSSPGGQGRQGARLCGLFPLQRRRLFRGLPIPNLTLWKHLHCHLATPLVRRGFAGTVFTKFFEWLHENDQRCPVLDMPEVSGDGLFMREFISGPWQEDTYHRSFTRALLGAGRDAESYIRATMHGDKRRELQRRQRRLRELGQVKAVTVDSLGNHEQAIRTFLQLEESGWKGRDKVALSCNEVSRQFFWEIAVAGLQRGQLVLNGIYLDDRPIAMSCDLLAPPGCFGFKTGFDERLASYAPGVRLMLEHIDFLYSRPDLEWMDSCTSAGSQWLSNVWVDRKTVTSVLVSTGMKGGGLAVAAFPLFRWLRRTCKRIF